MDQYGHAETAILTRLSDEEFRATLREALSLIWLVATDAQVLRTDLIRAEAQAHPERYRNT